MPTIQRRTSEGPGEYDHKNLVCDRCHLEKPCDCPKEDKSEES